MVGLLYVIIASLFKVFSFFVRRSRLGKEVGQTLILFITRIWWVQSVFPLPSIVSAIVAKRNYIYFVIAPGKDYHFL